MAVPFNTAPKLTGPPRNARVVTYVVVDTVPPKVMHLRVNELTACDRDDSSFSLPGCCLFFPPAQLHTARLIALIKGRMVEPFGPDLRTQMPQHPNPIPMVSKCFRWNQLCVRIPQRVLTSERFVQNSVLGARRQVGHRDDVLTQSKIRLRSNVAPTDVTIRCCCFNTQHNLCQFVVG